MLHLRRGRHRAEGESQDIGVRYRELLEHLPVGVYRTTAGGSIVEANRALAGMLGYADAAELRKTNAVDFYVNKADRSRHIAAIAAGELGPVEYELIRKDGSTLWVRDYSRAVTDPLGAILHYDGIIVDITAERTAREALQGSEADYRGLFENAHDAILIIDAANRSILEANQRACDVYGYTREELVGTPIARLSADPREAARRALQILTGEGAWSYETVERRKGGAEMTLEVNAAAVEHRGRRAILSIKRDITERKRMEDTIRALALHDALTGLPNRKLLYDRLEVAISRAKRNRHMLALMFLDLDGFKAVNDGHGHAVGDELLTILANRLVASLRSSDTVARLGGDEFTILISDVGSEEAATETARKVLLELKRPVELAGTAVTVTASLGIALYPADGASPDELLRIADGAMYRAKSAGKDRSVGALR